MKWVDLVENALGGQNTLLVGPFVVNKTVLTIKWPKFLGFLKGFLGKKQYLITFQSTTSKCGIRVNGNNEYLYDLVTEGEESLVVYRGVDDYGHHSVKEQQEFATMVHTWLTGACAEL